MTFPAGLTERSVKHSKKRGTPRCPKCGYFITWSYDEEAGFGVAWCLRTKRCGWKKILD